MRCILAFGVDLLALVLSFLGAYALLGWACWVAGSLFAMVFHALGHREVLMTWPAESRVWIWAGLWTLLGLTSVVLKRAGESLSRWAWRHASP